MKSLSIYIIGLCLFILSAPCHAEIYRWVDENGRVQFTDKKPEGNKSENISKDYKNKDPFKINIIGKGYTIPPKTKGIIRNSVLKMGKLLTEKLGIEYKDNTNIKVIIFGDIDNYIAYGGKPGSAGFYSIKNNEAVARKTYSDDRTLNTIIHETSHLLIHYNYGYTPRWLDEGVAEYFEGMRFTFSGVEIPPNKRWHEKLKNQLLNNQLYPLKDYISLSPRDWIAYDDTNDHAGYAYGWSIISFLMSSEKGQRTLKQIFSGLKNTKRSNDYSYTTIERFYPGGFNNFEKEWREWIYPKKKSTYY